MAALELLAAPQGHGAPGGVLFAVPPQANAAQEQIKITEQGFQPVSVTVRANVPAKITFIQQSDKTCATEVVIPDYNIKRQLPLNKLVVVEFTPKKPEKSLSCAA